MNLLPETVSPEHLVLLKQTLAPFAQSHPQHEIPYVPVLSLKQIPPPILNFFKMDPTTGKKFSEAERIILAQACHHELAEGARLLRASQGNSEFVEQLSHVGERIHIVNALQSLRTQLKSLHALTPTWVDDSHKLRNNQMGYIKDQSLRYDLVAISDVGVGYKPVNQDGILHLANHHAFAVADGIGGLAAGEMATCQAIDFFEYAIVEGMDLAHAVELANLAVLARSRGYHLGLDSLSTGTAFLAGQLDGNKLNLAFMGDVKAILLRDKKIIFSTADHTHGQELWRAGLIDQLTAFELNHVLNRCLGADTIRPLRDVEFHELELQGGDRLFFATDGVTDNFFEDNFALEPLLPYLQEADMQLAAQNLWYDLRRGMQLGTFASGRRVKPDNFSFMMIDYKG